MHIGPNFLIQPDPTRYPTDPTQPDPRILGQKRVNDPTQFFWSPSQKGGRLRAWIAQGVVDEFLRVSEKFNSVPPRGRAFTAFTTFNPLRRVRSAVSAIAGFLVISVCSVWWSNWDVLWRWILCSFVLHLWRLWWLPWFQWRTLLSQLVRSPPCDFFTARCYAERGYEIACRLSVRL